MSTFLSILRKVKRGCLINQSDPKLLNTISFESLDGFCSDFVTKHGAIRRINYAKSKGFCRGGGYETEKIK